MSQTAANAVDGTMAPFDPYEQMIVDWMITRGGRVGAANHREFLNIMGRNPAEVSRNQLRRGLSRLIYKRGLVTRYHDELSNRYYQLSDTLLPD